MIRLPASLERRLLHLYPDATDRQNFIVDALEDALEKENGAMHVDDQPYAAPELDGERLVGGTLHLFSDGGSRGNPGEAAIAYILEDPVRGEVLKQHCERIGRETNNVAEYRALIEGLRAALKFQPNRLICHLDSELVVKQVNGEYQVKMDTLKPFVEEIKVLAMELPDVLFTHIPRADNHRADALVNRALDEHPKPSSLPQKTGLQRTLWDRKL
jgi:ribonuclease HI